MATGGAGGAISLSVGTGDTGSGGDVSLTSGATTPSLRVGVELRILNRWPQTDFMVPSYGPLKWAVLLFSFILTG